MAISRKKAQEYADQLLEVPLVHIVATLQRGKNWVSVLHRGRAVIKCHASKVGMWTVAFMAQALGVDIPPVGELVKARVSSGVLWMAVGISSLDLRKSEVRTLLRRLLEDAEMQRATGASMDAD
jgi:hypothetical protein